jgi:hypothetical protein
MVFGDVKFEYRDNTDSHGKVAKPVLQKLLNCVNTLPIGTAECERGLSIMNIVCNSLRSTLTVAHISSLMFVSLCGPLTDLWEPMPHVKSWLLLNNRSAASTQGPSSCKPTFQDIPTDSKWLWKACGPQ